MCQGTSYHVYKPMDESSVKWAELPEGNCCSDRCKQMMGWV
jgi:hypothetical protein